MNQAPSPFPSQEIALPNGHKGVVFVLAPSHAWDTVDLRWYPLNEDAAKALRTWVNR